MGRTVAVIWHVSFSIVAAGLFFFFVLPRWPELMGQTSPTLGLILRIVTGALIGLAALPVVFTLQRTKRPELSTPELALRLRTASISLHVLAAVLIVGTAVSEIWLSLDSFGPWLFGVYGAAAAIALLGIFAFYLAFVAELPPPPPKPLKVREKAERRGRKKQKAEAEDRGRGNRGNRRRPQRLRKPRMRRLPTRQTKPARRPRPKRPKPRLNPTRTKPRTRPKPSLTRASPFATGGRRARAGSRGEAGVHAAK